MKKPNFFIVGAAKAGTTSLYHYLEQHSNIYMSPIKEPHYFCKDIRLANFDKNYRHRSYIDINKYLQQKKKQKLHAAYIENKEHYLKLFELAQKERAVGEASVGYLYSEVAAKEIYNFNNRAKIIIILRNPIERAFSHWMMDLRGDDVCRESFLTAIKIDQAKKDKGWGKSHLYIELGLYYDQVKRYLDVFSKNQVNIFLFDDLKKNPDRFFHNLFVFLDVKPVKIDISKRYNQASIPRYPLVKKVIDKSQINKIVPYGLKKELRKLFFKDYGLPVLTVDDKKQLGPIFDSDIAKLEKLIEKDLTMWKM